LSYVDLEEIYIR